MNIDIDPDKLHIYRKSYLEEVLDDMNEIVEGIREELDAREEEQDEPMEEY